MSYNNLVVTTKGTYRLWDKDFMDSIDLSRAEKEIVYSILNKDQKADVCGYDTYKCILTDSQIERLNNDPLFWKVL